MTALFFSQIGAWCHSCELTDVTIPGSNAPRGKMNRKKVVWLPLTHTHTEQLSQALRKELYIHPRNVGKRSS